MTAVDGRLHALHLAGAALLLVVGAVHTYLGFDGYGTSDLQILFFVNGAASAIVAAAVALTHHPLTSLAGIAVAAGSLAGFAISRVGGGVVGFRGSGLHPSPEAPAALIAELAVVVVLGAAAALDRRRLQSAARAAWPFD